MCCLQIVLHPTFGCDRRMQLLTAIWANSVLRTSCTAAASRTSGCNFAPVIKTCCVCFAAGLCLAALLRKNAKNMFGMMENRCNSAPNCTYFAGKNHAARAKNRIVQNHVRQLKKCCRGRGQNKGFFYLDQDWKYFKKQRDKFNLFCAHN